MAWGQCAQALQQQIQAQPTFTNISGRVFDQTLPSTVTYGHKSLYSVAWGQCAQALQQQIQAQPTFTNISGREQQWSY